MDYTTLATDASLAKTVAALTANNFSPVVVETKAEALSLIKELIPQGASVMNGASVTLSEIGLVDYLKEGKHGWNNLHDGILAETDPEKQAVLRQHSVISDYYLGSVHAVTENGELFIASNSGSQLPHLVYTSKNIILVVGAHKVTPTLDAAFKRVAEHVIPLEDARMQQVYGYGTSHTKTVILHKENPAIGRTVKVLLVKEQLGF